MAHVKETMMVHLMVYLMGLVLVQMIAHLTAQAMSQLKAIPMELNLD